MSSKCCSRHFLATFFIVAVFLWAYDFLVHGNLFVNLYHETANVWRPDSEMASFLPFCIAHTVAMSLLVTGAFFCWSENLGNPGKLGSKDCAYRWGLSFGGWVGVLTGITQAMYYAFLPIPGKMALFWLFAEMLKWAIAGVILSKLYCAGAKPAKKTTKRK